MKSDTEGDGATLVGQALGGASPKIKLNRLLTETDQNIQRGTEQILRGLYLAVRNPRSHEKFSDSEAEAAELILFIGYIVRQLDKAKAHFSIEDLASRVFDRDFVPQARYADLLVKEIPQRQRLDVFLNVYENKEKGEPENLRLFFESLFAKLLEGEKRQVCEFVSEELKVTEDEGTIRVAVGSIVAPIWIALAEVSRLRIENRLIRSISEGRQDVKADRCRGGALGTWGVRLFPHFMLKGEALRTIHAKLASTQPEEYQYIFRYICGALHHLSDTPPKMYDALLLRNIKAGSTAFFNGWLAMNWPVEGWSLDLQAAAEGFEPVEDGDAASDEDDIPF